jgi:hypothetical protein
MKKIFIGILLVGIAAYMIFRIYNKPHRDPINENSISISSVSLFDSFEINETEANLLYLDKVVELSGKIAEITVNQDQMPVIVLETANAFYGVRCTMADKVINARTGESIIVKGICTGYLSDVIITNASIIKSKN